MEVMNGCWSFARCAGGRLVHLLSTGAFLQEKEKRYASPHRCHWSLLMRLGRLPPAAVFFGTCLAIATGGLGLGAQTAREVRLTIRVTDVTGAVIPRAHIALIRDETTKIRVEAETDENGYAGLLVKPDSYRFSVASPGFFDWHEQIDVGDAAARKIQVKLTVGSCPPGPCVTVGRELNELMPISPPMDSIWVEEQPHVHCD
jgi:Carboxypeptidase regulatory-like domain